MKNYFKKINYKNTFIQLGLLLLVISIIRSCQQAGVVNGVAPIISGSLLNGETVDLKQYRGQPTLVHFWATWCPVCKLENSNIDAVAKDYQTITIAYWPASKMEVKEFMHKENLTMPTIVDMDGEWGKLYAIRGVPISFILDSQGNIQFIESGYTSEIGLRLRLWWAGK